MTVNLNQTQVSLYRGFMPSSSTPVLPATVSSTPVLSTTSFVYYQFRLLPVSSTPVSSTQPYRDDNRQIGDTTKYKL